VDKIKRQKEHINTILGETKVVQKEINSLNGKIERSFIETDEMIFRDAKNNDQCRKAYKLLANLQSEFNALVRGLDDIGTINRELRDIEDLLQREKEKNTGELIRKVAKDLAAVVKDNDKMISAIKTAKANKRS
jgi:molecular chaperone GrpE (heat shock protein)